MVQGQEEVRRVQNRPYDSEIPYRVSLNRIQHLGLRFTVFDVTLVRLYVLTIFLNPTNSRVRLTLTFGFSTLHSVLVNWSAP